MHLRASHCDLLVQALKPGRMVLALRHGGEIVLLNLYLCEPEFCTVVGLLTKVSDLCNISFQQMWGSNLIWY